jgi:hypothetical protein
MFSIIMEVFPDGSFCEEHSHRVLLGEASSFVDALDNLRGQVAAYAGAEDSVILYNSDRIAVGGTDGPDIEQLDVFLPMDSDDADLLVVINDKYSTLRLILRGSVATNNSKDSYKHTPCNACLYDASLSYRERDEEEKAEESAYQHYVHSR